MKGKTKKILFTIAEIGTVIWAVNGMYAVKRATSIFSLPPFSSNPPTHLELILLYFLSAVLILYLLRKYERR